MSLPSGTLTFLFSDIEGSTRLLAEDQPAYAWARSEHLRVLREALARHGGVEVDTAGDGMFAVFTSALAALAAAQQARARFEGFRVRMGLHSGEAQPTASGYVGMDVHRAARIAAAAHGGQVVLSTATAGLLGDQTGAQLRDLGEHRLKDLERPLRLYQLGGEGFPPLRSLARTNLPIPPTPFRGRERELGEAGALLARNEVRLVTLSGPGGVGKTRLAIQLAAEQSERYPDGVWVVPLASVAKPSDVIPAVHGVLGVSGDLVVALAQRRMLLVLDNFEHLLDAASDVADLMGACARLEVLVTSRAPLALRGEWMYDVPPLRRQEAVGLLQERAAAVGADAGVGGRAEEICAQLDDLPLAIELAAPRLRSLPPEVLLARLGQALATLTGGARDAPARQRTLRATVAWSADLLDSEQRRLLARLAVFRGGFTLEAAETVCAASLDALDVLVQQSLVRQRRGRYEMLETIRSYAEELLDQSDERASIDARHVAWFTEFARTTGSVVFTGFVPTLEHFAHAASQLRAERDNIIAAIERALAVGDVASAARLGGDCCALWDYQGAQASGLDTLRRVIEQADASESAEMGRLFLGAARLAEARHEWRLMRTYTERLRAYDELRIQHLIGCHQLAWRDGDDELARELAASAAEVELDPPPGDLAALGMWGHTQSAWWALHDRNIAAATALIDRALRLIELRGPSWWARSFLLELKARADIIAGQPRRALEPLREVAAMFLLTEFPGYECQVIFDYALAWEQEDGARCATLFGAAEAFARRSGVILEGDPWDLAGSFADVRARLAARLGDDECDALWSKGRSLASSAAIELAKAPQQRRPRDEFDLSPREREVLLLIAEGCSNAEIATRLVISPNTVSIHVSRVLAKMGVSSRTQAAAKAHAEGIAANAGGLQANTG
jgi:predicted ATPase/class 3 adenylate cyclase/DNA-binding CsgD family transcriptional regulator